MLLRRLLDPALVLRQGVGERLPGLEPRQRECSFRREGGQQRQLVGAERALLVDRDNSEHAGHALLGDHRNPDTALRADELDESRVDERRAHHIEHGDRGRIEHRAGDPRRLVAQVDGEVVPPLGRFALELAVDADRPASVPRPPRPPRQSRRGGAPPPPGRAAEPRRRRFERAPAPSRSWRPPRARGVCWSSAPPRRGRGRGRPRQPVHVHGRRARARGAARRAWRRATAQTRPPIARRSWTTSAANVAAANAMPAKTSARPSRAGCALARSAPQGGEERKRKEGVHRRHERRAGRR